MTKFNAGKASILALTAVFAVAAFLLGKSVTPISAVNPHTEWVKTNSGEWSDCTLDATQGPIKTRVNTFTCESQNGNGSNECTLNDTKTETETKKCDYPRPYCHADRGEREYTYHDNPAWIEHFRNNGTPLAGHELDFFTWVGDTSCVGFTKVCTDINATNYDSNVDSNEVVDNSVCIYDLCPNIGNVQTTVPVGDYINSAGDCVAKTRVCTDATATNYGGEDGVFDDATEVSDVKECQYGTRRWCSPADNDSGFIAIAVPTNEYPPKKGKPWVTGMDKYCVIASSPSPSPSSTPTPTPTATTTTTTSTGSDGGDGLGCATHDCSGNVNRAQGQVLGASTMAGTGSFDETLYSAIMSIGATLSAFGLKGFKKAKKASTK